MLSRTTLNIPDVDWERYKQITEFQERRLYEELTKPHNSWLALILNGSSELSVRIRLATGRSVCPLRSN